MSEIKQGLTQKQSLIAANTLIATLRHDELYRSFTVPPAPVLIPAEPPKNPDGDRPDNETKTEKE